MRQPTRGQYYLTLLVLGVAPVFGQSTFPDCGYLNGPTCSFFSSLFWSNASGACDWGLVPSNGSCLMGASRQSLPYDQSWVVWAMNNQQRYSIGADAKIDQILTVGTHNSYSSSRQGFLNSITDDQVLSITDQLNWGMRSIRLDPADYDGDWRVCHDSDTSQCLTPTISSNRLFSFAVEEVADWLKAHPNELIFLSVNSSDKDPNGDLEPILTNYIDPGKFFTYNDYVNNNNQWPTMGQLLAAHKQVVLFSYQCCSDLGFLFESDIHGTTPSYSQFPYCETGDGHASFGIGEFSPYISQVGEDRSGSVATKGWGVMDTSQVSTAAKCGFSNVELDFVDNLEAAFISFAELGPDLRREAAVWSWAPNDYGTLGPAVLRSVDGRWTSAPTGTNYSYACAIDTNGTSVSSGNTYHRVWYIASGTGAWSNGQSACASTTVNSLNGTPTSQPVSGYFAFPRNGKENNDLWQAELSAGVANLWLNYSAQNGGSGLVVNTNPVPVIHNGVAPPLVFDISTSAIIPPSGATLTVKLNLGTGSVTTDQVTITSPSVLRSYPLPGLWSATQNPGSYTSNANIEITSQSGTILAQTSVPFTITVLAGTTTTITSLNNPLDEGAPANFQINVTSNEASSTPVGTVQLFELVYDPTTQTNTSQNLMQPTLWVPGRALGAVVPLPPGSYQIGARFTSTAPFQASSESAPLTQVVTSYINPSPSSLTFTMNAGGALPAPQSFSGKAFGQSGPTITSNASWVAPFSLSGNGAVFTSTIQPTPAAQSLSPGQYTGQITASDGFHAAQNVAVTLNVRGTLQLSNNSVSFLTSGADYATIIGLLQGSAFPLQVSGGGGWASLQVAPGPNPGANVLLLALNPQGLTPGVYSAIFTVSSVLATNRPTIAVTMTVVPQVTIGASQPGITAMVDSVSYTLPQTFTWQPGSHHTISTTAVQYQPFLCAPLPGNSCPNELKYAFTGWDSGPALTQSIVAPSRALDKSSWQALFQKSWLLTAAAVPAQGGTISANPTSPDGYYLDGTPVQITATPSSGYTFAGFSGSLGGTANPQNLAMTLPRGVTAAFVQAPVTVTITSQAAGLPVTVDGAASRTPAVFTWQQGSNHTVVFAAAIPGAAGTQYLFQSWSDGVLTASRGITAGAANATYTAGFQTQYYVSASPSPAVGGSVTGGGWYHAGADATLQAAAAAGFQFASFSSDPLSNVNTTQNPAQFAVNGPKTVAANFGPAGVPVIYASLGGPNADDSNGDRVVPVTLRNVGAGAAVGVQITSISNINVVSGSGQVTVVGGPFPVPPAPDPNLAPNAAATISVPFQWPATATRIQFRVNFTANAGSPQGTYSGGTTLNLFR